MKTTMIYGQECSVCNGCKNLSFREGACNKNEIPSYLNSATTATGYINYLPSKECGGKSYMEKDA